MNLWVGRAAAWLTLGCVLVCFAVVFLRYVVNIGFIWLQELYVWQHAAVFMIGAGYTFMTGGHVKVDILYNQMTPRRQAMVNIFGTVVFLLPWLFVLSVSGSQFILSSWWLLEESQQTGGLPGYFLLKSVIWVFAFLVGMQGLALIARSVLFLSGREEYSPAHASH
ncbi:MAG: TRAP transporter small permease subunit [Azospirillum sp.]|nr:TRAP transporter small permease subunit [Azospirillum sp.]